MEQRQAVTRQIAMGYKKASKNEKGKILDEIVQVCGRKRSYRSLVLRQQL